MQNWRAGTSRWRMAKEEKKRDEVKERECGERNNIKCILNSKHRPHYEKISTFRMHNPREKDEKPAEELKEEAARVRDFCMDTDYLPSGYYKRYLIFRAVIIECIILYIHIVFLALHILKKITEIFT